jgi:hypothetical protein
MKNAFVKDAGGYFKPLLISLLVTSVAYWLLTTKALEDLVSAYQNDRAAIRELLGNTTIGSPAADNTRDSDAWMRVLLLLQSRGAIPEVEEGVLQSAASKLAQQQGLPPRFSDRELRTLSVAVHGAQVFGNNADVQGDVQAKRVELEQAMAALLAGVPGARERIETGDRDGARLQRGAILRAAFNPRGLVWSPRPELLQTLFRLTKAWDRCATNTGGEPIIRSCEVLFALTASTLDQLDSSDDVKSARFFFSLFIGPIQFFLYFFALYLLLLLLGRIGAHRRMHNDWRKTVRPVLERGADSNSLEAWADTASTTASRCHSLLRLILEGISADLARIRPPEGEDAALRQARLDARIDQTADTLADRIISQRCDAAANEATVSRWAIEWLAKSLPALGFLGTVMGISFALTNADLLVRAGSQASRASAMLQVSGVLGVAFTTTFIALILGLITSLISDWQFAREDQFYDDIRDTLTTKVNPTM